MPHITISFYIETWKFDDYSLSVAGVVNLSKSPFLQDVFFRISVKIFALILLLNSCYIIFVICDIT